MRRDRRFRYDWSDREEENERPERTRLDVNRMIGKMLPWALILGVVIFFLERWLMG